MNFNNPPRPMLLGHAMGEYQKGIRKMAAWRAGRKRRESKRESESHAKEVAETLAWAYARGRKKRRIIEESKAKGGES